MADATRFWNRISRRYERTPIADEAAYRKKLETTRRHFTPDTEVLEFGCGTGTTALSHAPHVGRIRAIDFSEAMIAIAESKRRAAGVENVTFECADIRNVGAAGRRYDVVLGLSVLHLLNDWRETLYTVARVLKPGGVFVSSTACIGDSMPWLRFLVPIGRAVGVLPEIAVFTTPDLVQGLRDAAFDIEHQWQPGPNKAVFIVARKPS